MNKKRKIKTFFLSLFSLVLLTISMVGCSTPKEYCGNGIPYIVGDKDQAKLMIYSNSGVSEETLGSKQDIFWLSSSVYEDETLSIDNQNTIYRFTEETKETFTDIENNIMSVLKINSKYLIIHELENSLYLSLYEDNFTNKIDEKSVEGTLGNLFVKDDTLLYSVIGDENWFTRAYAYNTSEYTNEEIYYSEERENIYPFIYNDTFYFAKNQIISDLGNQDVFELYAKQKDNSFIKVMNLEDSLVKILITDEKVYGLEGLNSACISEINLTENTHEVLFTLDEEAALGLYQFEDNIQLLTSHGIYHLKDDQLLKEHDISNFELMNQFY